MSGNYTAQPMDDASVENLLARRDAYKLNAAAWMDTAFGADVPVDAVIYPGFLTSVGNNDASSAIFSSRPGIGRDHPDGRPADRDPAGRPERRGPVQQRPDRRPGLVTTPTCWAWATPLEQQVDAAMHTTFAPALEWSGPAHVGHRG